MPGVEHMISKSVLLAIVLAPLLGAILAGLDFTSHPRVPFLWLKLPDPWLAGTFRQAAFAEDILIDHDRRRGSSS